MMRSVPLKSIEEGYEWSVPAPAPKRKPLPLRQCLVALLCALVVGQVVFVLQLPFLHQVQERVGAQGVVCLSPLHVWGVNASSVSFPTRSFAALKLVSGEGRVVSKVRGLRPQTPVLEKKWVSSSDGAPPPAGDIHAVPRGAAEDGAAIPASSCGAPHAAVALGAEGSTGGGAGGLPATHVGSVQRGIAMFKIGGISCQ